MTAGRINQVSISTPSRLDVTRRMLLSPSFNSACLSSLSQTTYSRHRLANVRMHQLRYECTNFALKAAQLELSKSAWSTARFSRHFSLITSSIDVGPLRIEQHVEGDERLMPPSSVAADRKVTFSFSFCPGEYTPTPVTSYFQRYSSDRIVR
jgi:hypothetical protein